MPTNHPARTDTPQRFAYTADALTDLAQGALDAARSAGASASEVGVSEGYGLSVTVRKGEVETIEHHRDKSISVTVYLGKRSGHASTSDFSAKAMTDTVAAALAIARYTAEDPANGLAEPELLAKPADRRELDLYHPWDLEVDHAIELARRAEAAAFALDKRITNSDGASVSSSQSQFVAANSNGFIGGHPSSRHFLSATAIAAERGAMERDDWYSAVRAAGRLAAPEAIGDYAGRRALARLRGRKIATCKVPVLFEAPLALGLIGQFVAAVSGGSLYRKSSFLLDSAGKQVFSPIVHLREDPFVVGGMGSDWFDHDGVATRARDVVTAGVLQGYFLGVYSARKLGLTTTGNAGGAHNLTVRPGTDDLPAMLRKLGRGLFVTDLMGQGVNPVTGDYSRGAAGYWVEGGEIRHPVHEITIAGNLKEMYRNIVAIGADVLERGGRSCGSLLIEGMTIAGE